MLCKILPVLYVILFAQPSLSSFRPKQGQLYNSHLLFQQCHSLSPLYVDILKSPLYVVHNALIWGHE